jgi:hypothetical protein
MTSSGPCGTAMAATRSAKPPIAVRTSVTLKPVDRFFVVRTMVHLKTTPFEISPIISGFKDEK